MYIIVLFTFKLIRCKVYNRHAHTRERIYLRKGSPVFDSLILVRTFERSFDQSDLLFLYTGTWCLLTPKILLPLRYSLAISSIAFLQLNRGGGEAPIHFSSFPKNFDALTPIHFLVSNYTIEGFYNCLSACFSI